MYGWYLNCYNKGYIVVQQRWTSQQIWKQRAKFAAPTQEYKEAFNLIQVTWSAE